MFLILIIGFAMEDIMLDQVKKNSKFERLFVFLTCYYAFFVNGMMVLMVGTILPYLIEEANLSFSIAGGLLSAFAIGNLLASFVNPPIIAKFGRKRTIIALSSLIPICLIIIMGIPSIPVLYLSFVFLGIGRGSVSIFNNTVVNERAEGKSSMLNILHMAFAIGAFLAPFLSSLYISHQLTWKHLGYTVVALFALTILLLCFIPIPLDEGKSKGIKKEQTNTNRSYIKSKDFYVIGLILFFYLGLENCVNGWFITYFKKSGIMSDKLATNLVSYTWLAVMIGRLVTAFLSTKVKKKTLILINCILTTGFLGLLISTTNVNIIVLSITLLGFFFAGIYPTCIANAGSIIKGSPSGMSMLLAIAALGGIIAPQIVGIIADAIGLGGAIGVLLFSNVFMVFFAIINFKRNVIE